MKKEGSVQSFEHSFFCLFNFTFRAYPRVGKCFKWCTWRYAPFRVSFGRIIDIRTFEADIPAHCRSLAHVSLNWIPRLKTIYIVRPVPYVAIVGKALLFARRIPGRGLSYQGSSSLALFWDPYEY
jgi:hypothetical protein